MTTALETSIDFGIFDWIEWDQSGLHEIFRTPPQNAGIR